MEDNYYLLDELIKRYPTLESCKEDILNAYKILEECFKNGHKLLIAGNGGSCADAEHIVGELMKGFRKKRHISLEFENTLKNVDPVRGAELSDKLQCGLPAIALHNHQGVNTAFINDVEEGGLFIYAQQLLSLGESGDVFLGISTSGNSRNVLYASVVAKAKGLKIIGLTGKSGGELKDNSDVCIKAPAEETFVIQELHLPIYHCLCLMLEEKFFK